MIFKRYFTCLNLFDNLNKKLSKQTLRKQIQRKEMFPLNKKGEKQLKLLNLPSHALHQHECSLAIKFRFRQRHRPSEERKKGSLFR